MPPAKLPKLLSRFIGGFRGVGQTSSLAITRALAPPFADIDRGTQGRYIKGKKASPKLAELCQCTEQLQEQGIEGPGRRCEALEDNVGSAWLPVCRLRSLSKVLPGFVAGVQGVRQDSNDSSHNLSAPSNIRCHQSRSINSRAQSYTRQPLLQGDEGFGGRWICLAPCMPPAKPAKGLVRIHSWHPGSQADL